MHPGTRKLAPHLALFAILVSVVLGLGFERSGWILMTQPVEWSHSTNSLLGYSYFRDGGILHKENHSTLRQLAYFAGAEAAPDFYFRRPVYPFVAAQVAPLVGAVAALVLVNLAAWAMCAWLCWRFTRRFYDDEDAAWWAALFAVAGSGFMLHALDMSAHLLSFTFYMAGVVAVYETGAWRQRVPARTHLALGLFLALACLQYNTGIALVAAYFVLAIRHNPAHVVAGAALLALAAQPVWGEVVARLHALRYGVALPDLTATELAYLERGLRGWAWILERPAGEMLAQLGRLLASFLFFEMPLVTLIGAVVLVRDLRGGGSGRERLRFALPFIAFPLLAALVFAPGPLLTASPTTPAATARGYLVYGIAIFFFAACGAGVSAAVRRRRGMFLPAAALLAALSIAWSVAHLANVLGPAKAYFLGIEHASHLFRIPPWEAMSLTGSEPVPRIFGGNASLADAGAASLPRFGPSANARVAYALANCALFAIVAALLVGFGTRFGARGAVVTLAALLAGPAIGSRTKAEDTAESFDRVHRLEAGAVLGYRVVLSEEVRRRLLEGLARGDVVALHHLGGVLPALRIGAHAVPSVRRLSRVAWQLDSARLQAALQAPGAVSLELEFAGGNDAWLGGWQRAGLPGRTLELNGPGLPPPVVPGIELRLLTDPAAHAPRLIAF